MTKQEGSSQAGEPLFPVWTNSVFRLALALTAAVPVSIPAVLWAWERTPYVTGIGIPRPQPVKFDHRHHVRDDGIDCIYCHADVERSASAGMPATSVCMGCHSQIWTESQELAPVRQAFFQGAPLVWNRVTRLPQFVFFNHSVHVNGGVGCVSCHGRVDDMPQVYAVASFTMEFCVDCHRAPEDRLRPLSQITNMTWSSERLGPESRARLGRELDAQPQTDCTTCHR